ncbi:hypothetical protein LAWI1_G002182, partial [Lachnellula willkommii]
AFISNLLTSPYSPSHHGIYTVRDPHTAHSLTSALQSAPKTHIHTADTIPLDLSNLFSIRSRAVEINAKVADGTWGPIRALVLNGAWQEANAATMRPRTFTGDGMRGISGEHGRIVLVSSWSHDACDARNDSIGIYKGDEYKTLWREPGVLAKGVEYWDDGYKAGMRRYGTSKLLLVMFMYELQRKLSADPALSNISVLSLDPGAMGGTGLLRDSPAFIRFLTSYLLYYLQPIMVLLKPNGIARTPKKSGHDLLLVCFDEKYLGEYPKAVYLGGSEKATPSVEARDEEKQRKLWVESLKFAKVRDGDTVLKDL